MTTDSDKLPLLIFDGDCGFCRLWIDYWRALTGDRVRYAPFQQVASDFPDIPPEDFERSVQLILPDDEVLSAARAVFRTLAFAPGRGAWMWCYRHVPGFAFIAEAVYRWIAVRRSLAYHATRLLFGAPLGLPRYTLVRWAFLRLLGLIYLAAFASTTVQLPGLIGSRGILPVAGYLTAVLARFGTRAYRLAPTLFWLNSNDAFLTLVGVAGVVLSLLLVVGLAQRVVLAALYVLYLSLVAGGQVFMAFQWDALLLEVGFLAIFLAPPEWTARPSRQTPPSPVVVWLLRWLLFRLMFSSGMVKLLSGDVTWRTLTTLSFHYETQPLPTPLAWYAHLLPAWFQRVSVGMVFVIELAVPFLIFMPRRVRMLGALVLAFLQVLILLTGNYAFFNWLTLALCLLLLDDAALRRWLPERFASAFTGLSDAPEASNIRNRALNAFAIVMILLSSALFAGRLAGRRMPWPVEAVAGWVAPFRIINTYGLFAVMTTDRPEIIVEGSTDGQTWTAYYFRYKPGDLSRTPHWVAPHQPRLDWQMWFAALGGYTNNPWFVNFMQRLLEGSPEVLALLEYNPFPDSPPTYVRAVLYDYRFTDPATWRETGEWWQREALGMYFPAVSLDE